MSTNRVRQLVRLAITQLRLVEAHASAGETEDLVVAVRSLRKTFTQLVDELGIRGRLDI